MLNFAQQHAIGCANGRNMIHLTGVVGQQFCVLLLEALYVYICMYRVKVEGVDTKGGRGLEKDLKEVREGLESTEI